MLSAFYKHGTLDNHVLAVGTWFFGTSLIVFLSYLNDMAVLGIFFTFMPIYAGYIFTGAMLTRYVPRTQIIACFATLVWVGMTYATSLLATYWALRTGVRNGLFYEYWAPSVLLGSLGAFVAIRDLIAPVLSRSEFIRKGISQIAEASFGIYFVHFLALYVLQKIGITYATGNSWIWLPVTTIAAMTLSFIVIRILQKVPYARTALCP